MRAIKTNPTQFIEDYYDIKLAKYQKILIEKFSRGETPILFGNQKKLLQRIYSTINSFAIYER